MRRQTGYRLPASGLFPALLLALLPLGMAQAQAPCPEYWMLTTRGCPQVLGTDPAPFLRAYRLASGRLAWRGTAAARRRRPGRPPAPPPARPPPLPAGLPPRVRPPGVSGPGRADRPATRPSRDPAHP